MLSFIYALTFFLFCLPSHPQPLSTPQSKQHCTNYCSSCIANSYLSKYQLATILIINQTITFPSDPNASWRFWKKCLQQFEEQEKKNKYVNVAQQLGTTSSSPVSFELASHISTVMAWIICLSGFSLERLSGLELLIMVQIIWQTFMTYSKTIPEEYATTYALKYSSGYFYYSKGASTANQLQLQTFNISSQYLTENFNFILLFYLVPLVALLICKILTFKQHFSKKALLKFDRLLQLTLYGTMINLTSFVTFSTIFYRFGEKADIGSNIVFAFGSSVTLGILIVFYRQPDSFKAFRYSFKVGFFHYHYYYYSLCIILTMILLTILDVTWPCLLPFSILIIYTLLFRPYKVLLQNIRSSFNLLVVCFAIAIRIVFPSANQNVLNILGVVLICALMPIALLLAASDIVFHFVMSCKDVEPKDFQYMLFSDNAAVEQMAIQENNRQRQNYESQKFKNQSYRSINYNTNNLYGSRFYEELKMIKKETKEREMHAIDKTDNGLNEIRQFGQNSEENGSNLKDRKYWGVKNQNPHGQEQQNKGKIEKEKIQETSVVPQEDDDPSKIQKINQKVTSPKQDNNSSIEKIKNEKYLQAIKQKRDAEDAQKLSIEEQRIRIRKMEEQDSFLKIKNAQMMIKETDNNFIQSYNQI